MHMPPSPRPKPISQSAKCWIELQGQVLLIRNAHGSRDWNIPGGSVEPGEAPEAAVRRELREELGLHIEALEAFCRIELPRGDGFHIAHIYRGKPGAGPMRVDEVEILEVGWFEKTSIPQVRARLLQAIIDIHGGQLGL